MATAVETSSQPRVPSRPANLALAGLVGAVYVVAALAVVLYLIPALWGDYVAPAIADGLGAVPRALLVTVQVAVVAGLVVLGRSIAGPNPVRGLRGGIFLVISAACAIFFLTRAVGLWAEARLDPVPAQVLTAGVGVALLVLTVRLLASARGARWMESLEEQGWFHVSRYKPAFGQKVRRLTLLGILSIGVSGWLYYNGDFPEAWTLALPFTGGEAGPDAHRTVTLVPLARYTLPVLLLAAAGWVAYRTVNLPTFAEFLIATEAEMNKVSWTSRKRLLQDTVVVLVTTLLMALFLLVVDLFWGWLLSRQTVGVLPPSQPKDKQGPVQEARW